MVLGMIENIVPPYVFVIIYNNKYIYSLKYCPLRELGRIDFKVFS